MEAVRKVYRQLPDIVIALFAEDTDVQKYIVRCPIAS